MSAWTMTYRSQLRATLGLLAIAVAWTVTMWATIAAVDAQTVDSPANGEPLLCFTEYTGDSVTDFSSADSQAVRDAVAAANPGGTVKIAGTCAGTANEGGSDQVVRIDKALTLAGGYTVTNWISPSAVQTTTLDALHSGRVISSTAALTVRDLTIQNGRTRISSPAGNGAGIYTSQGITLSQVVFYNNVIPGATTQGGGVYVGGRANVTGTQFISNTAFVGGGLNAAAGANITNTSFLSNTAIVAGGGAFVNGVSSLSGNRFVNNAAPGIGGGFAGETVSIADTSFISNTAGSGGAVYIDGMASITSTSFVSNTVRSEGGGAYFKQGASIENSSFVSNTAAGDGGGAAILSVASITGTSFLSNTSGSDGGGMVVGGTASITGVSFLSNRAASGGGAAVIGAAGITSTSFLSNTAARSGGGAAVIGVASINGSDFLNNTAGSEGGGALVVGNTGGPSQVVNTLFVNNRATNTQGNVLWFVSSANANPLALLHNTVASSVAADGAALYVNNGSVGITNTIVSNYAIAIERVDGAVNEDFNLFDNVTTPFSGTVTAGTHSITGTAAFADPANGDYQLTALSDAVNAGTNAGIAIDFFNMPRPYDNGFDMGYAEFSRSEIYLPHVRR